MNFDYAHIDNAPRGSHGGRGKVHPLFGGRLPGLLEELNEALAA